jgi:RNA polymerase sigma factor (sigma-70 family)
MTPGHDSAVAPATLEADVTAAAAGSRDALERVVRAIQPMVHRLALRFFGCPAHADDAMQEALVQVVTRLDRFDGRSAFTTWVYRVATNKFLSMARSPAERAALTFEHFDDDLVPAAEPASTNPPADLDHLMTLAEIRIGCTLAMLLCLDRDARMAYILGAIAELDHDTAAGILGCAPAAYRKRLERAREQVTRLMRRRCGVFDPGGEKCRCADRVPIATARGHLQPEQLLFATSREQVRAFPDVLTHIRRLEDVQRAAAIYQSHPDPVARVDLAARLHEILDGERTASRGQS